MNKSNLNNFFLTRPALSRRMVAKESGISLTLLNYILEGQRGLTDATWQKLKPVIEKYGYKPE